MKFESELCWSNSWNIGLAFPIISSTWKLISKLNPFQKNAFIISPEKNGPLKTKNYFFKRWFFCFFFSVWENVYKYLVQIVVEPFYQPITFFMECVIFSFVCVFHKINWKFFLSPNKKKVLFFDSAESSKDFFYKKSLPLGNFFFLGGGVWGTQKRSPFFVV